jgi:hypothetical protein
MACCQASQRVDSPMRRCASLLLRMTVATLPRPRISGCSSHYFCQQNTGGEAHQQHIEIQAHKTPGLPFTVLCVIAHEDGDERMNKHTTGNQMKYGIR